MVRNEDLPQMGAFAQAVARGVRAAVESHGLSGNRLAPIIGRSQSYVSMRMQGRLAWTLDEVDQIARALGMNPDDLIDRSR